MDKEFLRNEAARLRDDIVLQTALRNIRGEALERLARADVNEPSAILLMQATVAVCDGIGSELERMVMSASEKRPIRAV